MNIRQYHQKLKELELNYWFLTIGCIIELGIFYAFIVTIEWFMNRLF